jgi:class 3 adenylate cyclase/predicted ATPase
MQRIADWLESLGMSEYAERFAENHIDISVLPDLTDQDLEKLGVLLGDRRKMLRAISKLEVVENSGSVVTVAAATSASPRPTDIAERRQVTVMFSDLVGSTALSACMDPEDLREVISAYQKCVAETVGHFGGFVAKYMGDGVLIYYGYPQAHEDDAERAVRAGLELVAAVGALNAHAPLQTRVGIATGLVVVGDLIGSGASREQAIVGETPNLAARLQGIAEPNEVVIAEDTRKLIGHLFELEDLGATDLKGIAGPVRCWVALRPASVESRFDAFHAGGLTELVGREEELELLLRRWAKAKIGEGQVVLLSGEPGIGKSRLTAALMERLADEPYTRLRYFCSPQHTDSALYPIISQMQRAAGLAHDDTAQARLDKLDALFAQSLSPRQDATLLAEMLSLPNDGRYPTLELAPQQRRQKTLEALTAQLETLSHSNPVLMIFEDVHWIDPTTLEALGRTVDRLRTLRVLLIATHRPEFEPPWTGRPYVTTLSLNRLGEREIAAMIDSVTGNKRLPENFRLDLVERTDGIPLFVEEITKAALEAAAEGTAAAIPQSKIAVPASLHASLMARLDRLGPAKEVVQIGSALGREFPHALIAAVARKPEAELQSALERVISAGLLFRQGTPPNATYLFKHALVQDAAYGTLLRDARRGLHARIAEALESKFTDIAENQPEILARHCTEAGLIEMAAGLWGKAGQRSLGRSALVEAAEQLARALAQIATQPGTPALRREQIKLQVGLMNALMHTKGHAALETKAAAERARLLIEQAEALGEPPEDPLLLFSVLWSFWVANLAAFKGDVVRELASELLTLAEKQGASVPLMIAHRSTGIALLHTGDVAQCRRHFDRAIALYNPVDHRALAMRFGGDIGATILVFRSVALWILGYPVSAQADAERALSNARETGHAVTLMYALTHASMTHFCCGNYTTASAEANELVVLAAEKGSLIWKAYGASRQGFLAAMTDKSADAVQIITSAIDTARSTGSTLWSPLNLSYLATAYAALGEFDEAWRCIGEAMTAMAKTKETWWEAEVHRIAGEIAWKSPVPDVEKAQPYFDRALAVARQQQSKSWELRAAMSMARLWRDQGKRDDACELLAPVYGWFTEGFDTRDLKDAKALLDELAA